MQIFSKIAVFQTNKRKDSVFSRIYSRIPVISCLFFLLAAYDPSLSAQKIEHSGTLVSIHVKDQSFYDVLVLIEQQTAYKFAYNSEFIEKQRKISLDIQELPLEKVLMLVFKDRNISFSFIENQIILQETNPPVPITLSGFIKDSTNGEFIPGVIIYIPDKKAGTYSNNYGFYSITMNPSDSVEILISNLGFNKIIRKISGKSSLSMDFMLTMSNVQLKPVVVNKDQPDDNIKKYASGKTDISMEMVKRMTSINGNGDILSTIQMMPGVMAGLDGRPGYYIRGGNTDQNLVQLDEATLYNPNHLLGLVSIFNSSAIKQAYLLKAGFPASFGDHLSSILDVTMKDGNEKQMGGDIQAGTITSGFTYSIPVIDDKASFFISGRRSTIDLLLKPLNFSNYYSNYYFYDINAKLNFRITARDRLFLSFYQGRDNSAYSKDSLLSNPISYKVSYGNQAASLRWNHLFSRKIFTNTSVIYNNYSHFVSAIQKQYYAELYSGIRDLDFKTDFNYYPNAHHKISAGFNYLFQTLFPASVSNKLISNEALISVDPAEIPKVQTSRMALYFSDEMSLSPQYTVYLGGRIPVFQKENLRYIHFEPRVAILRLINATTSVKLSYTQMDQYLHLVQSYNASFPAEIWIGSSKTVKPQTCQEVSLGFFKNLKANMYQSSVEVYYKKMGNQLLFKGETSNVIQSNIESSLIFGKGESYGAEFYLGKISGRLTGWMAYTLSYSTQKFDSLNLGRTFPFANDRRHNLYLSASYSINSHWQIAANFVFTSGRAFTLFKSVTSNTVWQYDNPLYYNNSGKNNTGSGGSGNGSGSGSGNGSGSGSGKGSDDNSGNGSGYNSNYYYSSTQIAQNNYRLSPYNRLDLSLSYRKSAKLLKRKIETEWVFSVYNVYARVNTFFAYCSIDPVTKQPIAVEVSFVPVIPSISYAIKF